MKLSFGGGASEIGASFLLLRIDGKNIALDCGVRMSEDPMPDFQIIKEFGSIDCIVLSHAHMDHSGALPVLSREYPNARIYMTHASKDLVRILLYDSLKIMDYRETGIPIYADIHVEKMLDNIVCYSPNHTFSPFSDSDIRITFYGAGHIAGAAGIFLAGEEGSFFYSGDFSATKQQTVEGAAFPKLRPDVAVFESTYGDRLHASRDIEETRLIAKIASITGEGGKLLIPAFALGRSQEIILIINRAINKKQLPGSLKVYVDGMVNDICRVYQNNPNYLRTQYGKKIFRGTDIFYNDNVIPVNKNQALRDQIVASRDGLVIISSSGMLTGGPSQWYAEKLAGDKRNAIALTGYQDEESPGRQLLDMIDAVRSSEGDGDAVQRGDGDAVRSSEGDGDAVQCSSGDAVRSSEGDGDAVQRGGGDAVRSSDDGAVEYSGSVALHSVGNAVHSGSAVPANDHIFKIGEKSIPFQCDIGMYGLSAHADKMEILALAQTFAARNVFFNHGGEEVVNSLAAEFQKEYNGRVYIPKNGEVFTLNIRNKRKQAVGIEREPLIRMPTPNPPRPSETLTPTAAPNPLMPHETPTTAPNPLMPHETPTVAPNPLMPHETPTTAPNPLIPHETPDQPVERIGNDENGKEVVKLLWQFILEQYGINKPFTLEDLFYISYGISQNASSEDPDSEYLEELSLFRGLINNEPYFKAEIRRPFIFHAVPEEELQEEDSAMEVNAMLSLVDAYFPPETGLYKKGARFEEKKTLLYFNFPRIAAQSLAEDIESFEQETGWRTEISPECNLGAAEQLIDSLMVEQAGKKVSYYRTEGVFQVAVDKAPSNTEEICEGFHKMTGLSLRIVMRGALQKPAQADTAIGQMEQNQAFELIKQHFADKPHKVFKMGLKTRDGASGIELSFITASAGALYMDDIDRLSEKTRWTIWINKESNQHELLKAARELLAERNIAPKKVSYLPEKSCVQVAFDSGATPKKVGSNEWDEICDIFTRLTAAQLVLRS